MAASEEGARKSITAQVADVNKGLLSVRKIVAAGNRVVFDTDSYIEDKQTGGKMWLTEAQGMYMLNMWVKRGFKGQCIQRKFAWGNVRSARDLGVCV